MVQFGAIEFLDMFRFFDQNFPESLSIKISSNASE
jgi:hypothetical protein